MTSPYQYILESIGSKDLLLQPKEWHVVYKQLEQWSTRWKESGELEGRHETYEISSRFVLARIRYEENHLYATLIGNYDIVLKSPLVRKPNLKYDNISYPLHKYLVNQAVSARGSLITSTCSSILFAYTGEYLSPIHFDDSDIYIDVDVFTEEAGGIVSTTAQSIDHLWVEGTI